MPEQNYLSVNGEPYGDIECKRFYINGVSIDYDCPSCGNYGSLENGGPGGLSYPPMNQPFDIDLYCEHCHHEWSIRAQLSIKLELM